MGVMGVMGLTDGHGDGRAQHDPGVVNGDGGAGHAQQAVLAGQLVAVARRVDLDAALADAHGRLVGRVYGRAVSLLAYSHGGMDVDFWVGIEIVDLQAREKKRASPPQGDGRGCATGEADALCICICICMVSMVNGPRGERSKQGGVCSDVQIKAIE